MKQINIVYNHEYQFFVCMKHRCVVFLNNLKKHLRNSHKMRKKSLQTILNETKNFDLSNFKNVQSSYNCRSISYLSVEIEYRCVACDFFIKNKRSVEKHFNKKHDIDHAKFKKIKFIEFDVKTVFLQFFLSFLTFRSFVVQIDAVHAKRYFFSSHSMHLSSFHAFFVLSSTNEQKTTSYAKIHDLRAQYNTIRQQWQQKFDQFFSNDLHINYIFL